MGEAWGLAGRSQRLSVKMINYHFLIMFSGMHFNAYLLLLVLCKGFIALDEPKI